VGWGSQDYFAYLVVGLFRNMIFVCSRQMLY
jgi:hypothetical protein